MTRIDYALIDESKNSQPGLYTGSFKDADVGGPGIHKFVQDKTANDKLAGNRSIVPKPAEGTINTEALNYSIAGLISADYADAPGLTLMTPPDMATVCVQPKGSKCMWAPGPHPLGVR